MNCTEIRRKPWMETKVNVALPCPCLGPCPYECRSGTGENRTRGRESENGEETENVAHSTGGGCEAAEKR